MPPEVHRSDRPRILYIGAGSPWAGGAGYLMRQHMWLQALTSFADVHAALFNFDPCKIQPPYPCRVTALPAPPLNTQGPMRWMLEEWFSPVPQMVRRFAAAEARQMVRDLSPLSFDAVFAYRIDFARFAGVLNCPHLLLDVDDPEHLRRRQRMRIAGPADGAIRSRLDLLKLRRFERSAVARAHAAFVCQENDRAAFPHPQPIIVPNAIDIPAIRPPRAATDPVILFVGNLTHSVDSPNVDGLFWFVDKVWPLVLERMPSCTLHIVGQASDEVRHRLQNRRSIRLSGFVEDVTLPYLEASLSIAPIRIGTGTRIKILESMAWGCPVVSTARGCEGLPLQNGMHGLVAEKPLEFAQACVRVLNDPLLQESLGCAGYELVRERFDRQRLRMQLTQLLQDLVASAAPVAAA